jgi:hypothetical protein
MPSLIDIPELVGFFSYSRDDDQGSLCQHLRDAIQTELSAQLGRTRTDFSLWQDKSAISLGTLWEKQISQGINQAVFFSDYYAAGAKEPALRVRIPGIFGARNRARPRRSGFPYSLHTGASARG